MQPTVHFPVSTLALQRGGLVKAVRNRANTLAEHSGLDHIHIDVLGFQPRLEADVARLKAEGHLHPDVQVSSVLFSLDPSPSVERRRASVPHLDKQLVKIQDGADARSNRYFRDGLLELFVRADPNGTPRYIDYFNSERHRVRREEMDQSGRTVRVVHYPTAPNDVVVQRYIGRDGHCFLTIWQAPGSSHWDQSFLFSPTPLHFSDTGQLYTHAFERLLAKHESAAITTEFRENLDILPHHSLDEVVRSIRHPNLRKIVTAHSNHLEPPYIAGSRVSRNWRALMDRLDEYDALVVLTEAQRKDMAADFGHAERLEVIPQVAPPRKNHKADTDSNRLILVARTHPKKRVDEAIRVFRKVLDGNPDAVLEIFGFGYNDDEEQRIHRLIAELKVEDHVRFMPFTNNPERIYATACATLLTSASEGFPLILLESMSYGVPVVAYDSNYGPRDVIVDGENGYLADFEDSDALAKKILQLMQDRELRSRFGAACFSTLSRFDTKTFVANWVRVVSAPPRSDRVNRMPGGAVVDQVSWNGSRILLRAGSDVAPGTKLIFRRRHGSSVAVAALADGQWTIELPESRPGDIFDAYVRAPEQPAEKRLAYAGLQAFQRAPLEVYPTKHGSLSVRHRDNRFVVRGRKWLRRQLGRKRQ